MRCCYLAGEITKETRECGYLEELISFMSMDGNRNGSVFPS